MIATMKRDVMITLERESYDVITLQQSNPTGSHCRACKGSAPFHKGGCPLAVELRQEVIDAVYRRSISPQAA